MTPKQYKFQKFGNNFAHSKFWKEINIFICIYLKISLIKLNRHFRSTLYLLPYPLHHLLLLQYPPIYFLNFSTDFWRIKKTHKFTVFGIFAFLIWKCTQKMLSFSLPPNIFRHLMPFSSSILHFLLNHLKNIKRWLICFVINFNFLKNNLRPISR